MKKIAYIGIDYHMDSLSVAVIIDGEKKLYDSITMKNNNKFILKFFEKIGRKPPQVFIQLRDQVIIDTFILVVSSKPIHSTF